MRPKACTRRTATRSMDADGRGGHRARWRARCRRLPPSADDLEARGDALYGAWLCGSVLGNVGMALHHKLCHTLGGSFNLPHAEMHTVVLPHALAYNAQAAPRGDARASRGRSAARDARRRACTTLARDNGAPVALQGHRHAGRRPRPRGRPRGEQPLPEPAALARPSATRSARCCSAPSTARRREPELLQDHNERRRR